MNCSPFAKLLCSFFSAPLRTRTKKLKKRIAFPSEQHSSSCFIYYSLIDGKIIYLWRKRKVLSDFLFVFKSGSKGYCVTSFRELSEQTFFRFVHYKLSLSTTTQHLHMFRAMLGRALCDEIFSCSFCTRVAGFTLFSLGQQALVNNKVVSDWLSAKWKKFFTLSAWAAEMSQSPIKTINRLGH